MAVRGTLGASRGRLVRRPERRRARSPPKRATRKLAWLIREALVRREKREKSKTGQGS